MQVASTVDVDGRPREVRGVIGREEGDHGGHLLRRRSASQGDVPNECGFLLVRAAHPDVGVQGGAPPLVVFVHGGGWTSGTLDTYDWFASSIARDAHAVVASLDYRLAPGHRWPAAAEDAYAATVDLIGRGVELRADTSRVAVVGDSAGGNLAAVVALMARDRSGPPIAFQGLVYPATDMTMASPSIEENAHAPILTKADMLAFRAHYLKDQDPRHPYASPLLADDLSGLPPALVQVAEHDPLRDDGLRYATALREAGSAVRTTTYFGMPHGFMAFPRISRAVPQALGELCQELRGALA